MNDYMLRVLNRGDHQKEWTPDRHTEFVRKCEVYIKRLQQAGKLHAAQPLAKQGAIIAGGGEEWKVEPLNVQTEIQTGYYHIRAESLQDAIEIAKGNPEFEYSTTARVEVRPLKAEESATGFKYPTR
ncbi:MAG TPA: YciI family protein [Vicinamibacterales bacterium]|nr:YciI family protein [Vicinamibacterales bacterium]